jgi:hypothetical protein
VCGCECFKIEIDFLEEERREEAAADKHTQDKKAWRKLNFRR